MACYKIKSIEKTVAPQGASNMRWYKFIIANDKNIITNLRSGSKREVIEFAAESVKRLNEKYLTHIQFKIHKPVYEKSMASHL